MKRPFETSCFLIDRKLNELGVDQQGNPTPMTIDLTEVESFRPNHSPGEDLFLEEILLTMKSGDTIVIGCNYFEFKKLFVKKPLLKRLYESLIVKF